MDNPTLITADDDGSKYINDHVKHFLNTRWVEVINSFTQEDKERFFKLWTEHQNIIVKMYGEWILDSEIHKLWLEKQ
jgi:hypothetical protein